MLFAKCRDDKNTNYTYKHWLTDDICDFGAELFQIRRTFNVAVYLEDTSQRLLLVHLQPAHISIIISINFTKSENFNTETLGRGLLRSMIVRPGRLSRGFTWLRCAKAAEWIEILFGMETLGDPKT